MLVVKTHAEYGVKYAQSRTKTAVRHQIYNNPFGSTVLSSAVKKVSYRNSAFGVFLAATGTSK
jgi:hypothetical protein